MSSSSPDQDMAATGSTGSLRPRRHAQRLESLDFDMQESEQFVDYVSGNSEKKLGKWKGGFRWLYLAGVGLGGGAVAVVIQQLLIRILELKFSTQQLMFEHGHSLGARYTVWLLTSLALGAVAGVLVCYVEPCAAGSGIPEIKCYLNGIDQPNVLRFKTLVAKALGICCSVAAGLPCGKEGPMIHSGAIVGAQAAKASAGPMTGPYRLSYEARDLVAGGAAAGVAAAFGAPIGGVLFAVEEGATHMSPTILVRTFVCASFGALTVRFFAGPTEHVTAWGTLGSEVPVEFGRFASEHAHRYKIWELFIFAFMGACGGLLGAAANGLNVRLTRWRMKFVGPRGHKRFLEVLAVTAAIISFNFWAPLLFGGPSDMESFTSSQRLFVDAGGSGIRTLLHQKENLDVGMLLFFTLAHFAQLIWTYGLGVPSGLFVPSLLGGACFGRLLGQGLQGFSLIHASPGIYALVGATAMLSGMARITISLAVILMETTGEAEWGLPIFLTVVAAKWTGDLFNKGIYDIHIELKHVPLLEVRPEKGMLQVKARDFMMRQVVALDCVLTVRQLVDALKDCQHNGFPVVENDTRSFVGLIERSTLHHVLSMGREVGAFTVRDSASKPGLVPFEAMLGNWHPRFPDLEQLCAVLSEEDYSLELDLRPYANQGCYTVPEHASALRCYRLFRGMGLRHLPVLGKSHEVSGIITRHNLLEANEQVDHLIEELKADKSPRSVKSKNQSMDGTSLRVAMDEQSCRPESPSSSV